MIKPQWKLENTLIQILMKIQYTKLMNATKAMLKEKVRVLHTYTHIYNIYIFLVPWVSHMLVSDLPLSYPQAFLKFYFETGCQMGFELAFICLSCLNSWDFSHISQYESANVYSSCSVL